MTSEEKKEQRQREKIREILPHGYAAILKKTIKKESKKIYTEQHIRRCLSSNLTFKNNLILDAAIKLADEQTEKKKARKTTVDDW